MPNKVAAFSTQKGGSAKYNYAEETYTIRLNDPDEGTLIPTDIITTLTINEDLFSLLPTFSLQICDKGAFFSGFNVKNGDILYIKITPNIDSKDEPLPYIDSAFCIQSITCVPDLSTNTYNYNIVGIYNAQNYLNQVTTYPKTSDLSYIERDEKTSSEAIHEVLDDTTLSFNNQCTPQDNSLWINCNDTRSQFIEKIVKHAWVGEDDAPLIYTDRNGQTYYTSIKYLAEKKKLCKFENIKYYYEKIKPDGPEELTMLFGDSSFLHAAGPILNQGGYKIREAYYSPYNFTKLFDDDITYSDFNFNDFITELLLASGDIDIVDTLIGQIMENITLGKYRMVEYTQNTPYLASISNKAASQIDNVSKYIDCGMYFQDYHSHYDLAPSHNEMIRRSFFQNFINMTVDVHRLPIEFKNNKCRPVLSDKVYIDFSTMASIDKIHSGNYIVCGIKHNFRANQAYTMEMKCVTDGTFGLGAV